MMGSDAPTWKKDSSSSRENRRSKVGEEKEGTNTMQILNGNVSTRRECCSWWMIKEER
jgi:hypothetical protein